jgi:hypothetical protein
MKALLIAFYGCLLEVINCLLTKQERRRVNRKVSADLSVVTRTLQLPLYRAGDAHLDPIWTLGSAGFVGIVNCFVQYHVFAQSPPGRHPNYKYPVKTSHRTRFV